MTTLREAARAKLNLTLKVRGRRPDFYHELASLVAFAALGDIVELEPGASLELLVEGPFAGALSGDNLIVQAANAFARTNPNLPLGRFRLVKNLPVGAGLGGGSADAAAALRLLARANDREPSYAVLGTLAAELGSDVAMCVVSRPALITGRGERVAPLRGFPPCAVLLANPRVQLSAEAVYTELRAAPLVASQAEQPSPADFGGSFEKLVEYLTPRGNDLEPPALRLVPVIKEVRAALASLLGASIVRMSGSGPTCFALFAAEAEARRGAEALARSHPDWWIAATTLEGAPVA